jgi:hypothetical protein
LILLTSKIKEATTSLLTYFNRHFTYYVVEAAEVALVSRIIGSISLVLTLIEPFATKCLKIEWIYIYTLSFEIGLHIGFNHVDI